ncbi:mitotic checkpoint serine/threonine-protein kinase BUB1 beta [Nilaparvata lugens]|uniref:mitotic checkpoint serine/threonine-protein kinase BUB1 beta n=1 Tax=Nilaparvata lugens TaxID=108931 RepID=UPI00193DCB25|nr:mitotic checkpoint serine/threonine-protein kinase BUB1 beta [Nilaparvata lugens]
MSQPLDAELLDLTKENIQPLKHGRRADQLFTALHAELDTNAQKKLDEQREQFELAIRMYEGDDPLEPRYQFAHWIEQTHLKLGPNSKLLPLLEDTINLYKDDQRYRQDQRFIEMLVKFINAQVNPIELYQLSYNQGLGTMCAILYHSWAEELDQNNDWRRANQIYELGIMNRAEPLDRLKQAHQQFQLSVGRRMMNQDDEEEEASSTVKAPCRQAFTKLKKAQVKGTRLTTHVNPGILKLQQPLISNNNRQAAIPIYQENNEDNFTGGSSRAQMDLFPKTAVINKENSVKAGPWRNPHGSKSRSTAAAPPPSTPSFHVHQDAEEANKTNYQTPIVPRALKSIRAIDIACPVAIFEAPDPTKKVMYAKHKVYVGGREFQLEEIRAAIYNKRHAIQTGQKDMCEFQTPMIHFGKKSSASCRSVAPATASTPHPEPKALPVRLFADDSDNSDVDDDKDGQSIKFYRNDKNLISDDVMGCEVGVEKLSSSGHVDELEIAESEKLALATNGNDKVPELENCDEEPNHENIATSLDPTFEKLKISQEVPSTSNDNKHVPESSNCDKKINQKSSRSTETDSKPATSSAVASSSRGFVNGLDLDKLNISVKQEKVGREKDPSLVKKKSSSNLSEQKPDRMKIKKKTKPPSGMAFSIFTE